MICILEQESQAQKLLNFLERHHVARSNELVAAGIPRVVISRLLRAGKIQRLAPGVYASTELPIQEWSELAEISRTIPSAVIALISALAFHEIGTHMPYQHWIALPKGARHPNAKQRVRVTWLSEPYYSAGIEDHVVHGVSVRIYCPAKTVTDCFRMRSKVGYDVAIEALKEGWRQKKFAMPELDFYARLNRVDRVMRPYVEAMMA